MSTRNSLKTPSPAHKEVRELQEKHGNQMTAGLTFGKTVCIIVGCTTDYGLLSAEALIMSKGWLGFLVAVWVWSGLLYTTVFLGRCWNMVRERWPQTRHPYGIIVHEALGSCAQLATNIVIAISCFLFGVALLSSTSEILFYVGEKELAGKYCFLPLAVALAVSPFLLFGSPKDNWHLGALSAVSGSMAFVLLSIGALTSSQQDISPPTNTAPSGGDITLVRLAAICGIVLYTCQIHLMGPTIQQDMIYPDNFGKAVILSYSYNAVLLLSLLACTAVVKRDMFLGATSDTTLFDLLPRGPLTQVPSMFLLLRDYAIIATFNNPLFQIVEEQLGVPKEMTWKRVVVRLTLLLAQVFMSETLPHFGIMMAVVGGCLVPITSLILPSLCYLRLRLKYTPEIFNEDRMVWTLETVVCCVVMASGPVLIIFIMYFMGSGIIHGKTVFTVPCYINATLAHR